MAGNIPPVIDPNSLNPALNPYSPLALHHADNPAIAIVLDPLDGTNFISWSHAIKRGLSVKNKVPLIDGSIPQPVEAQDRAIFLAWTRANDLVLMWILNSIKPDIKKTLEYFTTAKGVWDELHIRYSQSDDTKVYQLEKSLSTISQGSQSLVLYCNSFKDFKMEDDFDSQTDNEMETVFDGVKDDKIEHDFESEKINQVEEVFECVEGSNIEDVEDIYASICKVMPKLHSQTVIDFLLNEKDHKETIINYGHRSLIRHEILTLAGPEWIYSEILTCVAYITWCERKSCPNASRHWNIPVWFAELARSENTDEHINKQIFSTNGLFRSSPSQCSTICLPIHDMSSSHFLLCKVDIDKKIIEICDTLRNDQYDRHRKELAESAVKRLESVSKLWGDESFKNSNWHSTFKYQYCTTLPTQPNGYDCGLYVCLLMMFPQGVHRPLTKEESISTRRRLALKLYTSKENKLYKRDMVTIMGCVTHNSEPYKALLEDVNPVNMNVDEIIDMIVKEFQVPSGDPPILLGAPKNRSMSIYTKYLVPIRNDDELKNHVQQKLDEGERVIYFKLNWIDWYLSSEQLRSC